MRERDIGCHATAEAAWHGNRAVGHRPRAERSGAEKYMLAFAAFINCDRRIVRASAPRSSPARVHTPRRGRRVFVFACHALWCGVVWCCVVLCCVVCMHASFKVSTLRARELLSFSFSFSVHTARTDFARKGVLPGVRFDGEHG